jgi:uncharacterized protein (DUF2062 family)
MKKSDGFWKNTLQRLVPSQEFWTKHPRLKPYADALSDPKLWRLHHEAVARGVAVGLFWGFAIPAAQLLVAAVHCVKWRANIPVAALMTMVTNPLTIGFWLWLAYQLGSRVLNDAVAADVSMSFMHAQWLSEYGWPTLVGMGLFAVGSSLSGYVLVKLSWRLNLLFKRLKRRQKVTFFQRL